MDSLLIKKFIIFIVVTVLLCACSPRVGDFIHDKKRHYVFQDNYKNDTISIGYYQMHTNIRKDYDSLYNHFSDAIINTRLSVLFSDSSKNVEINNFKENRYLEFKKLNKSRVKEVANSCTNCTDIVMVPIISVEYRASRYASASGGDMYFTCRIVISINLVYKNKIIYFKQMRIVEHGDRENYRNYHFPIPQEKWDGLVREVMKEYIERLE